jgi:hypothetical protein
MFPSEKLKKRVENSLLSKCNLMQPSITREKPHHP